MKLLFQLFTQKYRSTILFSIFLIFIFSVLRFIGAINIMLYKDIITGEKFLNTLSLTEGNIFFIHLILILITAIIGFIGYWLYKKRSLKICNLFFFISSICLLIIHILVIKWTNTFTTGRVYDYLPDDFARNQSLNFIDFIPVPEMFLTLVLLLIPFLFISLMTGVQLLKQNKIIIVLATILISIFSILQFIGSLILILNDQILIEKLTYITSPDIFSSWLIEIIVLIHFITMIITLIFTVNGYIIYKNKSLPIFDVYFFISSIIILIINTLLLWWINTFTIVISTTPLPKSLVSTILFIIPFFLIPLTTGIRILKRNFSSS